ncbi:MAG: toprim domain-containing protein [Marichromatium sp.]|nr:toprim domain-containing protein [Marichromatium sp.]
MSEGWLETHQPCPHCGSTDAASLNMDGWWTCFSCEKRWPSEDAEGGSGAPRAAQRDWDAVEVEGPVVIRGITEETATKFGYRRSADGRWHVAPYYRDGRLAAQHLRGRDKSFRWVGDASRVELFGQRLWGGNGKMVVVTEGEMDALSVSQAQQNKWPVVSIPSGCKRAPKDLANNIQWLDGYERIILLFDDDEPGQEAAQKAAAVLPLGKAFIGTIEGFKDANDALRAGRADLIKRAIWEARPWRPDGLVTAETIKERILSPVTMGLPWFDPALTELSFGRHPDKGQVFMIGAGTGIGKTAWMARQLAFDLHELKLPVGGFFMETETAELYQRVAGIIDGTVYHMPGGPPDPDRLWKTVESFSPRFFAYDSFGAADLDTIVGLMRYLRQAQDVRIFYVDNMSQLTDEDRIRESAEEVVKTLKSVAAELHITILVASHLASPSQGSHEEGARVALRHFYGSRKLGAWVDGAFGLERNTQAEDATEKLTTLLRVLKLRLNGSKVGAVLPYLYDPSTDSVRPTIPTNGDEYGFEHDDAEGF